MFEPVKEELLSLKAFFLRLIKYFLIATAILIAGIIPGVLGFCLIADLSLADALLNSLSLLGDISAPITMETKSGQYFIAVYGLFIETVFLISVAALVSPLIHRALHKMHLKTGNG